MGQENQLSKDAILSQLPKEVVLVVKKGQTSCCSITINLSAPTNFFHCWWHLRDDAIIESDVLAFDPWRSNPQTFPLTISFRVKGGGKLLQEKYSHLAVQVDDTRHVIQIVVTTI